MHNCHFNNVILQTEMTKLKTFYMKRYLILLLTALFMQQANAQFFSFGYPDPFQQRQQVQQEKITPPEYKGGTAKLNKFIEKNFKNPIERKNIDGKITVACIIGTKGKVIESQVVRGLDPELNEEALRVAKKLKFKPARQGKKKVKCRQDITFPIRHGRLSFLDLKTIDI